MGKGTLKEKTQRRDMGAESSGQGTDGDRLEGEGTRQRREQTDLRQQEGKGERRESKLEKRQFEVI